MEDYQDILHVVRAELRINVKRRIKVRSQYIYISMLRSKSRSNLIPYKTGGKSHLNT